MPDPPLPRSHAWEVRCADPGLRVDEQIERLIARLRPVEARLRALVDRLHAEECDEAGARLAIVRYLDDEDGEADGWQHRLLGWHLGHETLRFLVATSADIDADEYGQDSA
jgi:hypothetical protein